MPRLLRAAGTLSLLLLPLLGGVAHADTPSPSTSASSAPTTAGNSFRTASPLASGQTGQASGSIGDYFYWSFQAGAGQAPAVTATVQLPSGTGRQGSETWRLDVYDGLRRAQPCVSGNPQAQAATDATSVQLSCTLPTVRGGAETWSDDPLPGTYYIRLTVGDLVEQDLGLPVTAQLTLATPSGADSVGSADGSLSTPLTLPTAGPSSTGAPAATGDTSVPALSSSAAPASSGSSGSSGFFSGLFSGGNARWWWTGGGAVAAALAGVLGFTLTRHPRRWFS